MIAEMTDLEALDLWRRAIVASVRIDAGPGARVDAISFAADLLTPESLLRHALGGNVEEYVPAFVAKKIRERIL